LYIAEVAVLGQSVFYYVARVEPSVLLECCRIRKGIQPVKILGTVIANGFPTRTPFNQWLPWISRLAEQNARVYVVYVEVDVLSEILRVCDSRWAQMGFLTSRGGMVPLLVWPQVSTTLGDFF